MNPRPTIAALRNYVSMVFLRENPMLISASGITIGTIGSAHHAASMVAAGGIRALFLHHSLFTFMWWYAAFLIPSCATTQYWRQIRSNLATSIPFLRTAEFGAVAIVLLVLLALLAAPLVWLGVPLAGAVALSAIASASGSGVGAVGPTGQAKTVARFRFLVILPLIVVGSLPQFLAFIVFAPLWITVPLTALAASLSISGLRYFPAHAANQSEAADHRIDQAQARPARFTAILSPIGRIMTWKPAFMPILPLPVMLGGWLGPIGLVIATIAQIAIMVLYMPAFAWLTGHHFIATLHQMAPQSIGFAAAFSLFGSGQWLLNRNDWPILFMAGRYGGRTRYAGAMVRAFRTSVIEAALVTALVATAAALLLHTVSPTQAIPVALCTFALIFGAAHLPTIPLLWRERGGKGLTLAFSLIGTIAAMNIFGFGVFNHGLHLWAIAIAASLAGLGLLLSSRTHHRLATMDWPIDAEPAP